MAEPARRRPDDDDEAEEQRRRQRQQEEEEEMERMLLAQEQAAAAAEEEGEREQENANEMMQLEVPQQQQIPLPPPPPPVRKNSFLSYRTASFLAFAGLIEYAVRTRRQYYLAVVFLSSSKWAYVIAGNAILAGAATLFDTTVSVFLGGLRLHEAEGLTDFFRWSVTESCLALTIFRNELTIGTALQFVLLIVIKCLHHVAALREQHLRLTEEAVEEGRRLLVKPGHAKVLFFFCLLQLLDITCLQYTVTSLLATGPTVKILFAFEAAILLVSAWSHILLWYLHAIDSIIGYGHEREWSLACRLLHPWKEYKATLMFAVELQAQMVQFLFYSTFFSIVLTYYAMPINLFREVYMSFAALKERLTAFWKYRHLMAGMNRFEAATDQELDEAGRTCIICRDEMNVHDCKKLPICSHIFHKSCLREWLVQQQSCPTCRADIAAMEAQQAARIATANAAEQRDAAEMQEEDIGADFAEQPRGLEAAPTGGGVGDASIQGDHCISRVSKGILKQNSKRIECYSPTLYKVTKSEGIEVWSDTLRTRVINRTIPQGVLFLVIGQKDGMLEIPDGFVQVTEETDIQRIHSFVKQENGDWT